MQRARLALLLVVSLESLACGKSAPKTAGLGTGGTAGVGSFDSAGSAGDGHGGEQPAQRCVDPVRSVAPACNGVESPLQDRPYCIKVPSTYAAGSAVPLLLLLHGFNASGQIQADYFDFDALAEHHGFLLAKPDGTMNRLGSRYWNASPACCAPSTAEAPDDVAYLGAVLDDVEQRYTVDASRVYVVGHSNGAFMAQRLACDLSQRLAGVVSLAGAVDTSACAPAAHVSLLEVHGTSDQLVHYDGGTLPTFMAPYPSVDQTLAFWRSANGCSAPASPQPFDLVCDSSAPGPETQHISSSCADGTSTELWRMDGVGHIPAFVLPTWPEDVYRFLAAHVRR